MATYRPRPDGLLDVQLDDGSTVPMALSADQLRAQGLTAAPVEMPPPPTLAESGALASAAGNQSLMTPELAVALQGTGIADDQRTRQLAEVGARQAQQAEAERAQARGAFVEQAPVETGGGPGSVSESTLAARGFLESQLSAPRYIVPGRPAQDIRVGFQRQTSAPLTEEQRAPLAEVAERQLQAGKNEALRQSIAMDTARAEEAGVLQAREAHLAMERDRKRQQAQVIDQLRRARDERRRQVQTIEPDRVMRNAGGFGRVLALVSVALGGYLQGIHGGENPGLQMMRQAIADDIEAQKLQIAQQQGASEQAENDYQAALQLYGDPLLAEKQLELENLEILEASAQRRVQAAQDDATRAAAQRLVEDLRAQKAQAEAEWDGLVGTVVEQWQFDPGQAPRVVGGVDPVTAAKRAAELKKSLDEIEGSGAIDENVLQRQVRLPNGATAFAKDAQTATRLQDAANKLGLYEQRMARIMNIVRGEMGRTVRPTVRAELDALALQNESDLRPLMLGPGQTTDKEWDRLAGASGRSALNVTSFDESVLKSLEVGLQEARRRFQQEMSSLYADPQLSRPVRAAQPSSQGSW